MESYVARSFPVHEEYRKPTGISAEDIAKLRKWLQTQPHLPNEHITDLDLILALHSCRLCMETTKKVIDTHYTMKTRMNSLFENRFLDENIELVMNTMLLKPLAARTKDGDAVFYANMLDPDPKNFILKDFLRLYLMVLEIWQYEEGTWPGLVVLFDLEGFKLGHFFKIELEIVRQFLQYLEQAMLVKIKQIHILNAPYFVDRIVALINKFIKSELAGLLRIHQVGSTTLEKYIDSDSLPKESGGSKTYEQCKEETKLKIRANKEFFENEVKKRVTESLRPQMNSNYK